MGVIVVVVRVVAVVVSVVMLMVVRMAASIVVRTGRMIVRSLAMGMEIGVRRISAHGVTLVAHHAPNPETAYGHDTTDDGEADQRRSDRVVVATGMCDEGGGERGGGSDDRHGVIPPGRAREWVLIIG